MNREELSTSRDQINRKKAHKVEIRRREKKKDPIEKAKDKIWESIIKETENDDPDDDSSDEDEH
jgi:hypothetical protein